MPFIAKAVNFSPATSPKTVIKTADTFAVNPPPRKRRAQPANDAAPANDSAPIIETSQTEARSVQLRQPKGAKKPKKQPTGDYAEGYCRPPIKNRFQKGGPGGPGRPKGAKSQDTLLREELKAKQTVRVGGVERTLQKREIATSLWVNGTLEKRDLKHLANLIAEGRRLFPETVEGSATAEKHDPALEQELLRQLVAGLALGEAKPDAIDPLVDFASSVPTSFEDDQEGAWSEGDWNSQASSLNDEE